MTFEEALRKTVEEGAIRFYRLSENLAFVYRFRDNSFEAKGLYGNGGVWKLGERLVSTENYADRKGWHSLRYLPWQARAIESEEAKANPGYEIAMYMRCYTCKERKLSNNFSHHNIPGSHPRDWECDICFERRVNEIARFKTDKSPRDGDKLSKSMLATPSPPASHI